MNSLKKVWPRNGIIVGGTTFKTIPELVKKYQSPEFEKTYTYYGNDLGAVVTEKGTTIKLWSPAAEAVSLRLYSTGSNKEKDAKLLLEIPMVEDPKHPGIWVYETHNDLRNIYYTFKVTFGEESVEAADPYAKAAGVNGFRSMVVDLKETDPEGWDEDPYCYQGAQTEAIIWETQVKDFSHAKDSGMKAKGKYAALGVSGTTIYELEPVWQEGREYPLNATGIDHVKDLGITHIHLLPLHENATVDETKKESNYNWGYDPLNYNVPEGSFSEDPYHGAVRIKELKEAILRLHKQGIGVILDVVYNHTYFTKESWFERICPYYYHRTMEDGTFGNASGCGNETASERSMMRLYMLDSIRYWAEEYHIDGFRFDLMGIHDTDTINEVRDMLDSLPGNKQYLVYGEPWAALPPALPEGSLPANMSNLDALKPNIGVFNDEIRDGVKGSCFVKEMSGFANGGQGKEKNIVEGVLARCHKDDDHLPARMITYVSSHDNYTLWDKLTFTVESDGSGFNEPEMIRVAINKLCAAIVMMSQGTAFMQAGEEFGRSKQGEGNSYNLDANINDIFWGRKTKFAELYEYYRGLIAIRKKYSCFTDPTGKAAREINIFKQDEHIVGFLIPGQKKGDPREILVILNGSHHAKEIRLPEMAGKGRMRITRRTKWHVLVNESVASAEPVSEFEGNRWTLFMRSAMVAISDEIIE